MKKSEENNDYEVNRSGVLDGLIFGKEDLMVALEKYYAVNDTQTLDSKQKDLLKLSQEITEIRMRAIGEDRDDSDDTDLGEDQKEEEEADKLLNNEYGDGRDIVGDIDIEMVEMIAKEYEAVNVNDNDDEDDNGKGIKHKKSMELANAKNALSIPNLKAVFAASVDGAISIDTYDTLQEIENQVLNDEE